MRITQHQWQVRRLTDRDIAAIRLAKRRGMNGIEIASELNIPKATVYRVLGVQRTHQLTASSGGAATS
jgi:IS30 family transposase